MLHQILDTLDRSRATLAQDFAGAIALAGLLLAALYLPGLV
ncbi:hypothetical protein [Mesobaculum littorinae]|nr:hypothetical protein [Mesobaculum littorinae]